MKTTHTRKPKKERAGKFVVYTGIALLCAVGLYSCLGRSEDEALDALVSKLEAKQEVLAEHPTYANRIAYLGITSLEYDDINMKTRKIMFEYVKEKVEEQPELIDHFGSKAKAYMKKQVIDDAMGSIDDAFEEAGKVAKEKGELVWEKMQEAKDYIVKKVKGE